MRTWTLARLVLSNRVRREGRAAFLSRVTLLALLNVLLLSALFSTASGNTLDLTLLAGQYCYFIPLLVLSSAVGSWEVELVSGVGERYLQHPFWVLPSRLLVIVTECAAPFALFTALLLATGGEDTGAHLAVAAGMFAAFAVLGAGLGFCVGFRHEKAVNNFVHLAPWLLGFGPGPFFGNEASGPAVLFPGGFSVQGDFALEWVKLAVFALVGVGLLWWGGRTRRHRFFAR
ncbi:hypothetical protein ABZ635_00745 [Nocardiopsis sp. NPDC007018]|uniref:hypothetical protein n=1 Tax=Nocardiopsis sp. NPDC007018 TaxID=3155721 RepID=UPI0033E3FB7C